MDLFKVVYCDLTRWDIKSFRYRVVIEDNKGEDCTYNTIFAANDYGYAYDILSARNMLVSQGTFVDDHFLGKFKKGDK